jgi:hypothetical protein
MSPKRVRQGEGRQSSGNIGPRGIFNKGKSGATFCPVSQNQIVPPPPHSSPTIPPAYLLFLSPTLSQTLPPPSPRLPLARRTSFEYMLALLRFPRALALSRVFKQIFYHSKPGRYI